MRTRYVIILAAALACAGCNIRFAEPAFPADSGPVDTAAGDASPDAVEPDGVGPDTRTPDGVTPDTRTPDGVTPDTGPQTCGEADGICVDPAAEVELNAQGCPWGYERLPGAACPAEETYCCVVSPDCFKEGTKFGLDGDGVGCCPELWSIDACQHTGGMGCGCEGNTAICSACGNGACEGEWENPCNCEQDCPWPGVTCQDEGGICTEVCYGARSNLPGCLDFEVCCINPVECLGEGLSMENLPGSPPCCEPLTALAVSTWDPSDKCVLDETWYVCSLCGDGSCQEWESSCSCPEDCPVVPPENLCFEVGGACYGSCPPGWTAMDEYTPWCPASKTCCVPDGLECLGAGSFQPVIPDPTPCCAGLETIPSAKVNEDGQCDWMQGAALCSDCPNGLCEGWENFCNCPDDCGGVEPAGCDPWQGGTIQCPAGQFCHVPPHTCGTPAFIGTCVPIPAACTNPGNQQVCGCNGITYGNPCKADMSQQAIAYAGPCGTAATCAGLGEASALAVNSDIPCCGDLMKVELYADWSCSTMSPGFACVFCGDLLCGPGEDPCNCADDCPSWADPGTGN
ncbi:MAG: hypothetical protein FJ098_01975 [Deltaproteobacteria bacterium]|nr:hypothetical protein [Deltaproteobacteria bacterium]